MTHSPPIPAGNTSPYPLKKPPHVHVDPPASDVIDANRSDGNLMGGALLGIGAVLIVAVATTAMLVARRKPAQNGR